MTKEAKLEMFFLQRLTKQRVVPQIDHTKGLIAA
jgi:hypothetical protein